MIMTFILLLFGFLYVSCQGTVNKKCEECRKEHILENEINELKEQVRQLKKDKEDLWLEKNKRDYQISLDQLYYHKITKRSENTGLTAFWTSFPYYEAPGSYSMDLKLIATSRLNSSLTIQTKRSLQTKIIQGNVEIINMTLSFLQIFNRIQQKGIAIKSTNPISLYRYSDYGGRFAVIQRIPPLDNFGTYYIAISYHPAPGWNSFISIAAVEDQTTVNITLNTTGTFSYNKKRFRNGDTITLYLNTFDTFQISHSRDLTGSQITSDKPISIQSGDSFLRIVNNGGFSTHSSIRVPPLYAWGQTFVIPPIRTAVRMVIRVVPSAPNTVITSNSKHGTQSYHKSKTLELNVGAKDAIFIQCNKPCFVAQFAVSEPDYTVTCYMTTVPATEQYSRDYQMVTPGQQLQQNVLFTAHFVAIMVQTDAVNGLFIDGTAISCNNVDVQNLNVAGQKWSVITASVLEGVHTIGHISNEATYGAIAYGFGQKVSYAYALSLNI